jgi:hypothetical protein
MSFLISLHLQSPSANRAAEPQVVADRIEGNLNKPDAKSPLRDVK